MRVYNCRSQRFVVIIGILLAAVLLLIIVPGDLTKSFEVALSVPQSKVPASLTRIDEEAFAGTAFQLVVLNEKLTYIGEKAFEEAQNLQSVYIPESTAYIGSDAFPSDTIIHGSAGSYAQKWAEENSHRFQSDNVWNNTSAPLLSLLLLAQAWLFVPAVDTQHEYRFRRVTAYLRDMRPQERRELYPINYRFP